MASVSAALTPQQRLSIVQQHAALRWRTDPLLMPSHSNDSWVIDDEARGACVLRVCFRGDPGRLITEAKVGRALPAAVGYPRVIGYGWTRDEHDLTWSLTRRLTGRLLLEVWSELDDRQRQAAGQSVARLLRRLHQWRPSAAIADRLLAWSRERSVAGIVGATINPLPLSRVRVLAGGADTGAGVDAELVRRAHRWLVAHQDLAPPLDRPGLPVLHGDLHLGNVWWDDDRVTGLLDLEWVRRGPAYLDLSRMQDEAAADAVTGDRGHALMSETLQREYPELAVPRLTDRLRFFRIAYAIREMFVQTVPEGQQPAPDHPSKLIIDLLD